MDTTEAGPARVLIAHDCAVAREEVDPPQVKVIVLLPEEDNELVETLLHLRPHGMTQQQCSSEELRFTVRTAAAGRTVVGSDVAVRLLEWFHPSGPSRGAAEAAGTEHEERIARLTAREIEVLELVAEGRSTEEVAELLTITLITVRSHLSRLRTKIGVRERAGLVNFAFRTGLVCVA